jgi:hypothetical protein
MRLIPLLFGFTLVAPPAHPSLAQTAPPQESSVQFTLNARTVVESVVVTDKAGRSIPGLLKEDFQIYENGKLQAITFFEPNFDTVDTAAPTSPPPPNTFTNTPLTERTTSPIFCCSMR